MWFNQGDYPPPKKEEEDKTIGPPPKLPKLPEVPGVYRLVKLKNELELVYESNIFKTEELIFGNVKKRVLREWTRFCNYPESVGTINVGDMGSGKTNKCDILANLAIIKGNLPVIVFNGITITELEIQFINSLNNCCLYLDEFGKMASGYIQQKLLTTLTNNSKKFLILFTDNNKHNINQFILDRMQRARYLEEFGKLDKQAVLDYMSLFDVREDFKEEFLPRYEKALVFSFDNLKGIVSEHLDYPDDTLDELLTYLNTSVLSKKVNWTLIKLEEKKGHVKENDGYEEINKSLCRDMLITIDQIKNGFGTSIEHDWVRIEKDNVVSNIGGIIIIVTGNFRLTYKEE